MAIPDQDLAQVRAATDIVALIGEHVALRRAGRRWVGLCPFHGEKTPSFSVNAELGRYYCFGCQVHGDAIEFVRAVEHLDFVDAVRSLADRSGITLHEDAASGVEHRHKAALLEAMERAVDWYHQRLLSATDAGRARDYLRSRGYDGQLVRQFRLGWAPDDWDALNRALALPERVLRDSGLGFVNRRGRPQDAFRSRVIFPICDPSGRPIALGGRILPRPAGGGPSGGDDRHEPKYKNSSETPIYAKRRTLYALNWAKQDVIAGGEVVVCEGYTDVIGFFASGLPRAVATCGTALGEEHFAVLRNFAKRIVLAYDADSAGQSAVARVYEWERRHQVDVAVAALPAGSDPADLARTDPEALRQAVAEARPLLQFRVDRALEGAHLESIEGRARAADAAVAAVAEHPVDLVRDQYVMQVADRCRLDPAKLRQRLEEERRRPSPRRAEDRSAGRVEPSGDAAGPPAPAEGTVGGRGRVRGAANGAGQRHRSGLEALRLAIHQPESVADRLEEVLFVDDLQRRAFVALAGSDTLAEAVEGAPPEVAALLHRLAVEEPVMVEQPLVDPVDGVITQLVREAADQALAELAAAARVDGASWERAAAETAALRRELEKLDDPGAGREASDRLVAWLVARGQEA